MTLRDGTVIPPPDHAPAWSELGDPPAPKLSIPRLLLLVGVLAAVAAGVFFNFVQRPEAAPAAVATTSIFAPYVDVTLTPTYPFEDPAANPVSNVILGFIVASPSAPCTPSWGGYYSLAGAEAALNLDQRIAQVAAQGGTATLSFGGRDNADLATSCDSVPALSASYLSAIRRYHVHSIDLDVEGTALNDAAARTRRAVAIATVQRAQAARGEPLTVWLTLPAGADGLGPQALAQIHDLLASHVALAGVNLMAFDFAPSSAVRSDMIEPVRSALEAAHAQIEAAYRGGGIQLSSSLAWRRLGVTAMIGVGDVAGERFTVADARALAVFAEHNHIARVSMWSLNRDSQCGSVFAQTGVLSNTCSGVRQSLLEFTHIFSRLTGTETAVSGGAAANSVISQVPTNEPDDPADSPYPVWNPSAAYIEGYKVVWHRDVYQSEWYSQGSAPDAPSQGGAPSPWLLIGPVTGGAKAPAPKLLDASKHPAWSASAVYRAGSRVTFQSLPFEAKWYTQGIPPSTSLPASSQSPWLPLFEAPGEPADPTTQQEETP
jgi:chitinase